MKLRVDKGKIYIHNFCFDEIAEKYGTPFYLYDLSTIRERIHEVKRAFGEYIELFYAVKANSNLEILKAIRNDVEGLDISSQGEMEQSFLAGYDAACLSFASPGKTRLELQEAVRHNIGVISVESLRELRDIKEISLEKNCKANIVLRINPQSLIKEFAIKMGGKATQFGIDEEEIKGAIHFVRENDKCFNFLGIHVYAGTQCLNEKAIAANIVNTLNIATHLRKRVGFQCHWINLGGGFGVSYYEESHEINLSSVAEPVIRAFEHYMASTGTKPRFILELGRYLVADAGIYVSRVVSEKKSREESYFVLDGGMNHHLAASGNLGAVIRKNYITKNLSQPTALKKTCNLVGPLCTPIDILARNVSIESPKLGHLIGILNSGSYAFTASPLLFLGHNTPAELLLADGDIRIIRAQKKLTDFN